MADEVAALQTQGFISYRRVDNEDFGGVVDEIARTLAALFEARTGQQLRLFLDRESIGWGEDWRGKIEDSVRKATIFIPIITMRYFNSQACMDELLAFEATARRLGVTDLILPLVLFGSDEIRDDDPRPEVALIARLNYRSIEKAWECGYQSPEWRQFLSERAKELALALARTEDALAAVETDESAASPPTAGPPSAQPHASSGEAVELDDDADSDVDLAVIGERFARATEALEDATTAFGELAEAANGTIIGVNFDGLTPAETNSRMVMAAHALSAPSKRLEDAGKNAESILVETDPALRSWLREMNSVDLPEARELLDQYLTALGDPADLDEVEQTIEQLSQMLKMVSLMNVSLRKALRPAVRGLRSLLSAVRIYRGWQRGGGTT